MAARMGLGPKSCYKFADSPAAVPQYRLILATVVLVTAARPENEVSTVHCPCPLTRNHEPNPCLQCPARHWTICHALPADELALLEGFKSGDRVCGPHVDIYSQGEELDELYTVVEG